MTDQMMVVTVPLSLLTSMPTQVSMFAGSLVIMTGTSSVILPTFQSQPLSNLQGD